jgi:hypothetical protein
MTKPNPETDFEGFVGQAMKEALASLPANPTPEFWVASSAARLKRLVELKAPPYIIENEKRILLKRVAVLPVYDPDYVPFDESAAHD